MVVDRESSVIESAIYLDFFCRLSAFVMPEPLIWVSRESVATVLLDFLNYCNRELYLFVYKSIYIQTLKHKICLEINSLFSG
jgi:hypothetical protein